VLQEESAKADIVLREFQCPRHRSDGDLTSLQPTRHCRCFGSRRCG
jgi:hypothetical protein